MSTLIHKLDKGVVISCGSCSAPIKDMYFTHLCETRKLQTLKYCFECLSEKGICKYCKRDYLMKTGYSI